MEQTNKIKKIFHYNEKTLNELNQVEIKLIEEMSELTQAILKYDITSDKLLEEVADVQIMLNQYKLLINSDKLDKMIDFKLDRTILRLHLEKEETC